MNFYLLQWQCTNSELKRLLFNFGLTWAFTVQKRYILSHMSPTVYILAIRYLSTFSLKTLAADPGISSEIPKGIPTYCLATMC